MATSWFEMMAARKPISIMGNCVGDLGLLQLVNSLKLGAHVQNRKLFLRELIRVLDHLALNLGQQVLVAISVGNSELNRQ
jgi:hypothetical protein